MRPPPRSTLFPYTTLFRSVRVKVRAETDLCARCYQPSRSIGEGFSVLSDSVLDRKSTRLNSSHRCISYAVFCLKKKTTWSCCMRARSPYEPASPGVNPQLG